ncbi:MAG: SET domain-containing protein-lysine N-methyltransferase [Ottowia sp.]|nr:SET domain-containing protein-lysine N-methyltransferase [Ottowia sp.]
MSKKIEVKTSVVHGRGVFALRDLKAGEKIIEYKGERIDWAEAENRHPHDPKQPEHTFYFSLETGSVIDGGVDGNIARWINHACQPNCEAREINNGDNAPRVFIFALTPIAAGDELFYDYGLVVEGRKTKKLKLKYACYCGDEACRGTMLAS